jgi:membrane protease YdiL (CAAX protease family)
VSSQQISNTQSTAREIFREVFAFRWRPSLDLLAVAGSWVLVVAGLYTATFLIGTKPLGGMGYFLTYAVLTALVFGFCFPVGWMLFFRKASPASLGITSRNIGVSIALQIALAAIQLFLMRKSIQLPGTETLVPLLALSLSIGLFESVFWRGWVQLRIQNAFGTIPGIVLGSVLYALYHVGYGMPWSEIGFLFFIGLMFAVIFRITSSVFILWPLFQPMGQLVTLVKDKLQLPLAASIGFLEVLAVMVVVVIVANKISRKRTSSG